MKFDMKRIISVNGTPTLEEIEVIRRAPRRAAFPVVSDCLEELGVVPGGIVAVDFTRFPAAPRYASKGGDGSVDVCACWAVFPGMKRPSFMLKAYLGVWGAWQMVGTRYDKSKQEHILDCAMEAKRIFGVVCASWDKGGNLMWERDLESFPAQLGTTQTIRSGEVGNPIDILRIPSETEVREGA